MPTDFAAESARMAEAFGLVAAGAVPVGAVGWYFARRPVLPPCRRPAAAWTGFDVLALFLLHFLLGALAVVALSGIGLFHTIYGPDFPPVGIQPQFPELMGAAGGGAAGSSLAVRSADANAVRSLWGAFVAVPILVAAAGGLWMVGHGRLLRMDPAALPGNIAAGIAGWLIFTPVVLGINFVVTYLMEASGTPADEHPLTNINLNGRPGTTAVFAVVACVLSPLAEELLFRSLLIGWGIRWKVVPGVVLGCWLFIAFVAGVNPNTLTDGRLLFGLGLVVGLAVFVYGCRRSRVAAAVFASSAAFGLAHPWWPTPVPLFAFGIVLGILYVRTGNLVAPVIAHGLFNAVSFVYLLRGGTGGM